MLYGDSFLQVDYAAVARRFDAARTLGLMTVYRNEGKWDTSNVVFRDGRILVYDKKNRSPEMQHIDYGLGVLRKEALDSIPADQLYDLASLYQDLVKKGQLTGFEVFERFYEIGTTEGLGETRQFLSK